MGILSDYFTMGLGTSRLPIKSPNDTEGIEKSAMLILDALDAGVRYIDTAYPYAAGGAHAALKLAFAQTSKPYSVTVKVLHQTDKTADEARRRAEHQLTSLGIDKAAFFVCWCIPGYGQFREIMRKGGVYDGAQKLKDEGLISHICCSLHASASDSIKIIESGVFEAATVSFNLANAIGIIPVLDAALKHQVDIAVMNPLGGGGIPQNPAFFAFAQATGEDTVTAALRFAKSHPAVKIVLSGISNIRELAENHQALAEKSAEPDSGRLVRVINNIKDIVGYCVNCRYCEGCPANIPIAKIMDRRNRLLFPDIVTQDYRRTEAGLLQNINLFFGQAHMEDSGEWFPVSSENPCVQCGQCEKKCTQKLPIIESLKDMYNRAEKCGFSLKAQETRLRELLGDKNFKRVGLYPKDRFADAVMKLYEKFFGKPDFEWIVFNSDPTMRGRVSDGLVIHSPDEIPAIKPDIIIVCNYTYAEEIYNDLRHFQEEAGTEIVKLHRENDVPWVF
jgi:predicted aldo/keto reductase-like oxidoreductase